MTRSAHKRGFTLIEMLVTIGVIAVLAAITIPQLSRMKAQSVSAKCSGQLRQIGIAINLYAGDHQLRLPVMVPARESLDDFDPDLPPMDVALAEYLSDEAVFHCPGDHGPESLWKTTGTSYFWNSTLNGQPMGDVDFLGISKTEHGIPMISDKENFHQNVGDEVNILYADGHVDKQLQFVVDPN